MPKSIQSPNIQYTETIEQLEGLLLFNVNPSELENIANYFQKGSLAMVKSEEKNSSSTEFFFVTDKIPELDGRYSIFGKVIQGFDVLENINKEDFIRSIKISN